MDGILQELSHSTGAMVDKGFLAECYRFSLLVAEVLEERMEKRDFK